MASYSSEMMQKHIYMKTGTSLALTDIEERPTRGTSKAFRVSVPTSKKETILSIWNPDVKAELFNKKRTAGNQYRSGTFRNPNPQSTNRGGLHSYGQNSGQAHNQVPYHRWGNQNTQNRPPQRYQGNRGGANWSNGGAHYQQGRRVYQPQQQRNQPQQQYSQSQQLNQYPQQYFQPHLQGYQPQPFVQNFQ